MDLAAALELEARDAAVCRDVLILLADGSTSDRSRLARESRQIAGEQQAALELVQRLEQRGREAARRAEARARRNIGERRDLVLELGDAHSRTLRARSDAPISIRSTCSIFEYFRKMPGTNGRCSVTHTYLSIAAEIRKPP